MVSFIYLFLFEWESVIRVLKRRGMCRFPRKEISEISEISVTDNNSDRYTY
jgi:hypothetical protein